MHEVEKATTPYYKKALNKEKKSPRMVFTEEYADLVEKGKKWMKDTTLSTLVATLIITVTFAAIFTVPGGNNDKDGTPKFHVTQLSWSLRYQTLWLYLPQSLRCSCSWQSTLRALHSMTL